MPGEAADRTEHGHLPTKRRAWIRSERGQTLVEYAIIISIVSLGAVAALVFLRGNIVGLFSNAGSQVAAGAGSGGSSASPPPAGGTQIGTGNGNQPLIYLAPGQANGQLGSPGGIEGIYALAGSPDTSFTVNGWTFQCAWHIGAWTYDVNQNGSIGAGEAFATMCNAPPVPTNSVAPTITGTPQRTQTLNAINGTWSGSPSSFTYQWFVSASGASCPGFTTGGTAIPALLNGGLGDDQAFLIPSNGNVLVAALPPTVNLVGRCLRVEVRASNASGNFSGGTSNPVSSSGVGPVT